MFNLSRSTLFTHYNSARNHFIQNPNELIELEKFLSEKVFDLISRNIQEIKTDYNEASYLFPFWQNYPPDDRGRMPKGDQFPWIEIGEHVIGRKLIRFLEGDFQLKDTGLPSGSDERIILANNEIANKTNNFTQHCWLFVDVKSVGPRDDQEHAVMSHNQISGSGRWGQEADGLKNDIIIARGSRQSHNFYPSIPPIYILSDGTILPVVIIVVKPVYDMINIDDPTKDGGQPIKRISVVTIPNGLLLTTNPNYLNTYPKLFFPGKDDKGKNPLKIRARVSFPILISIAEWRVKNISIS